MFATRNAAVALLVTTLSLSACEFFSTKPFAPNVDDPSYVEVPDALAKYAPGLPPNMYARANAFGVAMPTGSVAGDALAGLRLSAAPLSPTAVDLAALTPSAWVRELGIGLQYIDDDTTPQALPFAFSFYGQSYSSVYVSANGHISFGSPIQFKRTWNIPDGAFVLAAPAYADWMPASRFTFPNLQNSRVYVNTVGEVGNRRFVVTWNDMRPCCSLSYPGSSFQLQLLERTGEIVLAYREMQMIVSNASAGIGAGARNMRAAAGGAAVLALQGCAITYTPTATGYREANSCAPAPVNVPPVVQVGGPYAAVEGASVDLSGSATDENGDALTYAWTIGDGTNLNGQNVSHLFVDNGSYAATLAVSDGNLVTLVTTRVDVSNAPPSLGSIEGATRFIGDPYDVSVSLSDAGVLDAPWHYSIAWGDGASDEGDATSLAVPIRGSHAYSEAGTYTVRVSVRDKDGGAATPVEAQVVVKIDEIDIDIKPWHARNLIYLRGGFDKLIAVAVLSSENLDASSVNVASLRLGSVPVAKLKHGGSLSAPADFGNWSDYKFDFDNDDLAALVDIDRDGDRDLLVVFDRKDLMQAGDLNKETTSLTLNGLTIDGRKVVGTDAVQIIQ